MKQKRKIKVYFFKSMKAFDQMHRENEPISEKEILPKKRSKWRFSPIYISFK